MKLETTTNYRILIPSENMWLYNAKDRVISDKVYLGVNADESAWTEIDETKKIELEAQWENGDFSEATEQDYQDALAEMGVDLNE